MDPKHLEQEVYEALRHEFIIDEDDDEYDRDDGKNFCAVPPGILLGILNTLVIPVVTAIMSEFLVRKFMPEKDDYSKRIGERARCLNNEANKKIERCSEEILYGNQTSDFIVQNISTNITINIAVNSPEDGEKLISDLEQYLHRAEDSLKP